MSHLILIMPCLSTSRLEVGQFLENWNCKVRLLLLQFWLVKAISYLFLLQPFLIPFQDNHRIRILILLEILLAQSTLRISGHRCQPGSAHKAHRGLVAQEREPLELPLRPRPRQLLRGVPRRHRPIHGVLRPQEQLQRGQDPLILAGERRTPDGWWVHMRK